METNFLTQNPNFIAITDEIKTKLSEIVNRLITHDLSNEFIEPVDCKSNNIIFNRDFPSYSLFIKKPICLNDIKSSLEDNKYSNTNELFEDIRLIWENCKAFNEKTSLIYHTALYFEKLMELIEKDFHNSFIKVEDTHVRYNKDLYIENINERKDDTTSDYTLKKIFIGNMGGYRLRDEFGRFIPRKVKKTIQNSEELINNQNIDIFENINEITEFTPNEEETNQIIEGGEITQVLQKKRQRDANGKFISNKNNAFITEKLIVRKKPLSFMKRDDKGRFIRRGIVNMKRDLKGRFIKQNDNDNEFSENILIANLSSFEDDDFDGGRNADVFNSNDRSKKFSIIERQDNFSILVDEYYTSNEICEKPLLTNNRINRKEMEKIRVLFNQLDRSKKVEFSIYVKTINNQAFYSDGINFRIDLTEIETSQYSEVLR
jgi:hypothetical protein